jgi:GDP-D-mannose 3', 5'-epimerase
MGENKVEMKTALVLGAGGFIGNAMVKRLKSEGYWVRGVDLKEPDFSESEADDFVEGDLRDGNTVSLVMFSPFQSEVDKNGFDEVYQFAADMGGAGYIFTGDHDADLMQNSALINLHVCQRAVHLGVKKLFYSSSACMYPQELQTRAGRVNSYIGGGLKESDAYPANPDSEYGWEKLFSERLYLAYQRNYGMNVRIARFHNIYGPDGTYKGGKEKAPAAMCRKVVESVNEIEVWGDGKQTRSFLYIDDCIDAVRLLMQSEFKEPINIGSEEMVSINQLAQMAIDISGKPIQIKNVLSNALGVRGRNSDNTLIRQVLRWEPKWSLKLGLEVTYKWINQQINGK